MTKPGRFEFPIKAWVDPTICEHRRLRPIPVVGPDGLLTGETRTECIDCDNVVSDTRTN